MLLLLGVLMAMAGLGFCLAGEIKLPGQRKLRAAGARFGGGILLSFLPLVLGVRFFIDDLEGLHITLINWGLALLCLVGSLLLMLLKSESTAPVRKRPSAASPPTRSSRTSGTGSDPFDFS